MISGAQQKDASNTFSFEEVILRKVSSRSSLYLHVGKFLSLSSVFSYINYKGKLTLAFELSAHLSKIIHNMPQIRGTVMMKASFYIFRYQNLKKNGILQESKLYGEDLREEPSGWRTYPGKAESASALNLRKDV